MTIQDMLNNDKEIIINRINSGESTYSIAKDYDCNAGSVWIFLKNNGIEIKNKRSDNYGKVDDMKPEIERRFSFGQSCYKIGKELGISKQVILSKLKKWGQNTSSKRTRDYSKPMLKDRLDTVKKLHETGISQREIAENMGYDTSQITKALQKLELPAHNLHIKYSVDEEYFEQIDTQEKAYILGWWYSDGNVLPTGKIRIQIASYDRYILEWIKQEMKYTGDIIDIPPPPNFPNRAAQSLLNIDRKVLADQLIRLGCSPAKSMNLQFPSSDIVPENLISHFVRGYFDGDGSCSNGVTIVGTIDFLDKLKDIMPNNYTNIYQRYKDRDIGESSHQLFIGRKADIQSFASWLYKDAKIWLQRKRQLFGV